MLALEIMQALLEAQGTQVTPSAVLAIVRMGAAPVHIYN